MSSLNQEDIVLTALQDGESYSPVQLQKLLFLIDREAPHLPTPFFNFQPYDYGPFDKDVYDITETLSLAGLLDVNCSAGMKYRRYCLTEAGLEQAKKVADTIDKNTNDYIKRLAKFVRERSFTGLVSAIYDAYPEMKVNSVFNK